MDDGHWPSGWRHWGDATRPPSLGPGVRTTGRDSSDRCRSTRPGGPGRRRPGPRPAMAYDEQRGCSCRPTSTPTCPSSGSWSRRCACAPAAPSPGGPPAACTAPRSSTGCAATGGRRCRCPSPAARCTRSAGCPGDDLVRDILLDPTRSSMVRGVPCTTVLRATFDAMRYAPTLREAVVVLDMMAAAELTRVARMREYIDQRQAMDGGPAGPGGGRAGRRAAAVPAGDPVPAHLAARRRPAPAAGQPPRLRPRRAAARLPRPARPEAGVIGEYDGRTTATPLRHSHDVGPREAASATTCSRWSG